MSQTPEYETSPVPQNLKNEYYKFLGTQDMPIYVCAVANKEQKEGIFIEKNFNQKIEGTCRMFFRQEDVQAYMETIAMFDTGGVVSVKQIETDPEDLVEIISALSNKNVDRGGKGFQVMVSMVHE